MYPQKLSANCLKNTDAVYETADQNLFRGCKVGKNQNPRGIKNGSRIRLRKHKFIKNGTES